MSQSRERPPLSAVDKPVPKAIGNAVGLVAQVATAVAIEGTKATFAVAKFVLWGSSDSKPNQQPKPSILKNIVGDITSLIKETFQEVKKAIQADIQKDRQKEAAANMKTQQSNQKFTVTARGLQNTAQKGAMPIVSSRSLAPQPSMPKDRPIIRQMTPGQMKDAALNSARQNVVSAESQREKLQTISRSSQCLGERGR